MSQLKLDHHGKSRCTGRPFRPIVGPLSSAHPQPRLAKFELRTKQSRARYLTSVNPRNAVTHPPMPSVSYYLTTDPVELHCSLLLTRTPGNIS
ncbi:unnamed protein product [Schistosoma bovis]|nr:unnamed protein product [Schistosoma bovis]CAH8430715.1 unnamed protein product [Schistosoma bovis]